MKGEIKRAGNMEAVDCCSAYSIQPALDLAQPTVCSVEGGGVSGAWDAGGQGEWLSEVK